MRSVGITSAVLGVGVLAPFGGLEAQVPVQSGVGLDRVVTAFRAVEDSLPSLPVVLQVRGAAPGGGFQPVAAVENAAVARALGVEPLEGGWPIECQDLGCWMQRDVVLLQIQESLSSSPDRIRVTLRWSWRPEGGERTAHKGAFVTLRQDGGEWRVEEIAMARFTVGRPLR